MKRVHIPHPKAIENIHVDISSSAVIAPTAFAAEKSGERSVIRSQLCLHSRDILRSNRTGRKNPGHVHGSGFLAPKYFPGEKTQSNFCTVKIPISNDVSPQILLSTTEKKTGSCKCSSFFVLYVCVSLFRLCFAVMTHSMLRRMTLTLCHSSVLAHFFSKEKTTTVSEQFKLFKIYLNERTDWQKLVVDCWNP